ncbi:hypothetical protein FIBSPDRAFT_962675 [Athelia psychrophila]|uniref:Uncharacterized protein n=1 Tax=Athelia psychrophila TaxID=1759441 RepID=A0A165ZT23_9AGAM|nr:hypothetical protein FIBSPDRAFT_962675 [Fibularhizoctonia sp. CBS 109695]
MSPVQDETPFTVQITRTGREFSMFAPLEKMVTRHSFLSSIRAALELNNAGIDSPRGSPILAPTSLPLSPLTPLASDDSMEVSRSSIEIPSVSPPSSPISLPPPSSPISLSSSFSSPPASPVSSSFSSPPASPVSLLPALPESQWSESDCSSSKGESEYGDDVSECGGLSKDAPDSKNKKCKCKHKTNPGDRAAKKAHLQAKHQAEAEARGPHGLAPLYLSRVTSTGFTGKRLGSLKEKHIWRLDEVEADGMEVFHWDGCTPIAIIDDENRIIAVLLGRPVAKPGTLDDWPTVVAGLEAAINKLGQEGGFSDQDCNHRRGPLPAKDFGISHGGGQTHPRYLNLGNERNERAVDAFRDDIYVKRAVGFASSGFSCFAPKMYERVFPSVTNNCGPKAASYDHLDYANAAGGWCSITSAGTFDPKHGGHLILFDIAKVIEFLPGSTILLPSAVMRHGNTSVREGETRVSMTQYAAGALFRWVDNGFIRQKDTSKAHKDYMAATAGERFKNLLNLYSTLDSLQADRDSVFNSSR